VDRATLLALIDASMATMYATDTRATPGGEVVKEAGFVCCRTPRGTAMTNLVVPIGRGDAAALHRVTDRVYRRAGHPFSVWLRAHADDAVAAAAPSLGFREITTVPGMVLAPGDAVPPSPPDDLVIAPVADETDRRAFASVVSTAWTVYGTPAESTAEHFATPASVAGPRTQAFLARRDGVAVAGAILYLAHGVGGIGWVATLPAWARRGYGAAVTWAVVRAGLARGAAFLSLQASPMGAPVYRRLGFTMPTHYRVFVAAA
jgi:predicted GNAT family acetyltransferase